eukprot:3668731-Amphidinium_carterae.4
MALSAFRLSSTTISTMFTRRASCCCLSDIWTSVLCTNEEVDDAVVQEAVAHIGYHPFHVPPCSADLLYEACRQRKNSSNGLNDIDLAELASLPEIEGGAPWPSQLLQVKLSPMPKKNGRALVASGKVRLIAVSSHVYRCWGSMRAQQCSVWLSQITPPTMLAGVFTPFRMRPSSRLPDWSLVTKGWLGPTISPTRGLPQGDSLSVFMCVLWGIAACKSIEAITAGNVQVAV